MIIILKELYMNIGIDFDGTISNNPGFFRELSECFSRGKNRIYVISSYTEVDAHRIDAISAAKGNLLKEWGIRYDELTLVREPIPENKAAYCKDHNIRLMIDDLEENLGAISRKSGSTVCLQYIGR